MSLRPRRAPDGERRRASWWYSLRAALASDDRPETNDLPPLCELIDEAKTKAGIEASISTLRVLDVILWMEASRRARAGTL